jgi:hypothetical protein
VILVFLARNTESIIFSFEAIFEDNFLRPCINFCGPGKKWGLSYRAIPRELLDVTKADSALSRIT